MAQSTEKSAIKPAKRRRGPGRPFPKGVSGNPGGRKKVDHDLAALCREYTAEAIHTLVDIMKHGKYDSDRRGAANSLLDRGYGKPLQPHQIKASQLSDDELRAKALAIMTREHPALADVNKLQ